LSDPKRPVTGLRPGKTLHIAWTIKMAVEEMGLASEGGKDRVTALKLTARAMGVGVGRRVELEPSSHFKRSTEEKKSSSLKKRK